MNGCITEFKWHPSDLFEGKGYVNLKMKLEIEEKKTRLNAENKRNFRFEWEN